MKPILAYEKNCPYDKIKDTTDYSAVPVVQKFPFSYVKITEPNGKVFNFNSVENIFPFSEWKSLFQMIESGDFFNLFKPSYTGFTKIEVTNLRDYVVSETYNIDEFIYREWNGTVQYYKVLGTVVATSTTVEILDTGSYLKITIDEVAFTNRYILEYYSTCSLDSCLCTLLNKSVCILNENKIGDVNYCNNETLSDTTIVLEAAKVISELESQLAEYNTLLLTENFQTIMDDNPEMSNWFIYVDDEEYSNYSKFFYNIETYLKLKEISNSVNAICCCKVC
jgi:hypothetical protein